MSQAHLWDAPSVPSLSVHVSESSALLSMYKMVRPICLYIRWLGLCIFPCIRWLGLYPGPTSELPCLFPAYLSVLADFSPTPEQIICQRVFLTSQTAWSLCPGRRVFLLEPEPCCWPFIGLFFLHLETSFLGCTSENRPEIPGIRESGRKKGGGLDCNAETKGG